MQDLINRRNFVAGSIAAGLSLPTFANDKQDLPSVARVYVGFAPGAGPDLVARQLALQLNRGYAKSVVVENRMGASGNVSIEAARQQAPNGNTLLLLPDGVVTLNPHTFRKLSYSVFDDLTPVSLVCRYDLGFAVGPMVPESVKNLNDFILWAKQANHTVSFGSPAAGATPHFVGDVFNRAKQLNMIHVPYRGAGPMVVDVIGGQIAAGISSIGDLVEQSKGGKLRVLAATGPKRSSAYPDIPTFEEQGVKGLKYRDWMGVYIAGKPSNEILEKAVQAVHKAVNDKDFIKAIGMFGFEAAPSTPQELDALGKSDYSFWKDIVDASGFKQES